MRVREKLNEKKSDNMKLHFLFRDADAKWVYSAERSRKIIDLEENENE